MSTIAIKYEEKKNTPSDINEHLEVLYKYAKECNTIAEFGVRDVVSSYALAHAHPKKLICVDIKTNPNVDEFIKICANENINMRFDIADTTTYELENVDMLFIDTLHTFTQLTKELNLHHSKVNKYIAFHDTISYGYMNEDDRLTGKDCGLVPAIKNFLRENKNWIEKETYPNNNGLTIIERIS